MKRLFDLTVASLALIFAFPLFVLVAAVIRIHMGPPALFRHLRPGLNGCPFYLLKFRTMLNLCDETGNLLPGKRRLTPLGRLLRSLSLDELPQLINVLKGEMSLVGPRPLLMEYLDLYTSEQKRRLEVRPGITGWAQVNGRNAISWEERFVLDVWYVDHQSFWLDLIIIWLTLVKVIRREGVTTKNGELAEHFSGAADGSKKGTLSRPLQTEHQGKDQE